MTTTLQKPVERDFRLFVYGTLKQGHRNHRRYCANAVSIQPATLWGRLHHLDEGYPGLEVPCEHIIAEGTRDPLADARLLADHDPCPSNRPTGDWDLVAGEVITLANPGTELPPIDSLEAFHPGAQSEYYRVMVTATVDDSPVTVWTYRMPEIESGTRLTNGVWQHTG